MTKLRLASLVTAALLAVALGVADRVSCPMLSREPAWAPRLAPLGHAPLAASTRVALVVPDRLDREACEKLLFEACWQRPDLFWGLANQRVSAAPQAVVVVGDAAWPLGWRAAWRQADVVVLERMLR